MNVSHVEAEKGFNVIGIPTTNKAAIADGTIQNLWQKFFNKIYLKIHELA